MAKGKSKGSDTRRGAGEHVPTKYKGANTSGAQDRVWVHRKLIQGEGADGSFEAVEAVVARIHPHQATPKVVRNLDKRPHAHYKGPYFTFDLLRNHEITKALASAALHDLSPKEAADALRESLTPEMLEPVTYDVTGLIQDKGSIALGLEGPAPDQERAMVIALTNQVVGEGENWVNAEVFRPGVTVAHGDLNNLQNRDALNEVMPTTLTFAGVEVAFNQ